MVEAAGVKVLRLSNVSGVKVSTTALDFLNTAAKLPTGKLKRASQK